MIVLKKNQSWYIESKIRDFSAFFHHAQFSGLILAFRSYAPTRGKNILEQLSKPRYFTEFENHGLFSTATQQGKRAEFKNSVKNRGFEICSNIFFPLIKYVITFVPAWDKN